MSFAEHFANGPSLFSMKSCKFGNRVLLQFKRKTMLLSWRLGKSAKAPHICARDFDQVWLNVTLKWTWGCDPHWSSCWLNPNWGEESSQLALFGGSPLWSFVLIFYGSHVFCFPVEVGWQEMQFWKLDLEKGECLTCVCSRHLEWPLHMGSLQCWCHACHTVSHGLVGTSWLLPGLKREELCPFQTQSKPGIWARRCPKLAPFSWGP